MGIERICLELVGASSENLNTSTIQRVALSEDLNVPLSTRVIRRNSRSHGFATTHSVFVPVRGGCPKGNRVKYSTIYNRIVYEVQTRNLYDKLTRHTS